MSKVLQAILPLFFLSPYFGLSSTEKPLNGYANSVLEWSGHPILLEKKLVETISREFLENLKDDTESKLERIFSDIPANKKDFKKWNEQLRKQLEVMKVVGGIRYSVSGVEPITVFVDGSATSFPEASYEFSFPNVEILYFFRNIPAQPLEKWMDLKIQGSFYLYSESGALLLYQESPDLSLKNRDISEVRSLLQEERKKNDHAALLSEDEVFLFYFPNHNLWPYYIFVLSKLLILIAAIVVLILYSSRFWSFLKDQNRRTLRAELSFIKAREKLEKNPDGQDV